MKYLLAGVLLIGTVVLFCGTAQAVEPKVSYFWEATESEFVKLIGTSVKEDIVGIKGLDIDAWYLLTPPATELKYDEIGLNNLLMTGVSYSKEVKGFDVGINVAIGQDRIEALDVDRLGETRYGIGLVFGKKF